MFETTLPPDANELMRLSGFMQSLDETPSAAPSQAEGSPWLSTLSPSLRQDLLRFEQGGGVSELLEVLAASRRHHRALLVHVSLDAHVLPLTVFPEAQLVHCTLPPQELLGARLAALVVLHVEPALLRPPGAAHGGFAVDAAQVAPLGVFAWELALRGARSTLLPELAGVAAYRVTPAADLRALGLRGSVAAAVSRLQRDSASLREISLWPGFSRDRASRLLNGLYLQAALIVSRTHPAATHDVSRRGFDIGGG
ncbi:MAG: hypothetical protein ABIX12_08430 [Rubrivivax sp.]